MVRYVFVSITALLLLLLTVGLSSGAADGIVLSGSGRVGFVDTARLTSDRYVVRSAVGEPVSGQSGGGAYQVISNPPSEEVPSVRYLYLPIVSR